MPVSLRTVGMLLTLCGALPHSSLAQSKQPKPVRVSSAAACQTCRFVFKRTGVIGGSDDDARLNQPPFVIARDSRGRLFPGGQGDEPPAVFAASGRLVRRLGRIGDGPGETRTPTIVTVGPGDSVYYVDQAQARLSVFDPAGKFVRGVPFPRNAMSLLLLARDVFAMSGDVRGPDNIGYPLHLVDKTGTILKSFGTDRPLRLPRKSDVFLQRRLAPDGNGGFWAAHRVGRYRIEHWDAAGTLVGVVDREAEWYPPYTEVAAATPNSPPQAQLQGVAVDEQGRLWTLLRRPAPRWREGVASTPRRVEGTLMYPVDKAKAWRSVLEVIDPNTGDLLASAILTVPADYMIAPGVIGSYREDAEGTPRIEIWSVALQDK